MYRKTRAEGFGAEVKRRIMLGTYVLSHGYYDAYYLQAQKVRRMIAATSSGASQHCDVIAGPAAPTAAFQLGEQGRRPGQGVPVRHLHAAGQPGRPARHERALPASATHGLPVGLQLIGNYLDEGRAAARRARAPAGHRLRTARAAGAAHERRCRR